MSLSSDAGNLLAEASVDDLIRGSSQNYVRVRSLQDAKLAALVGANGGSSRLEADGALAVNGMEAAAIGDLAGANGIVLHELSPQEASLEEAYMELTHDSVEYRSEHGTTATAATATGPQPAGKVA